jgi:hypothetical protein
MVSGFWRVVGMEFSSSRGPVRWRITTDADCEEIFGK